MSQSDLDIANISRSLFRDEVNTALQALASQSSGATEPSITYAFQLWADITSGKLKQRNAANDNWIIKGDLAEIDWGFLRKSNPTVTGLLSLDDGADIASASTVDLTAATGNTVRITGTTAITAFTMNAGQQMELVAVGALPLTYNATTMNINGGVSYTCAAGDRLSVTKDGAGVVRVNVTKQDGTSVVGSVKQIQPITASVASNALTITLNPTVLDFRSSSLTSGTVNTRAINSAISTVISSGSTGGTISGIQSRIAILAIDNAGTVVLGWTNLSGGLQLDETNLITTTAEGGAGAADSANVIYTTVAVTTPSPYRVVGYVESTQATAGTWVTAPSTIQGYGGQALAALSSLGYGQTRQNLTGSRAVATTYYNTTGKPIKIFVSVLTTAVGYATMTIGGLVVNGSYSGGAGNTSNFSEIILPGESYILASALVSSFSWQEVR